MGVRGIVVAGLASKERRDFLASEARQRAALHRLPPYAVLVMDGATRRPMAGPIMALLGAGRSRGGDRADPPMLIFDAPDLGCCRRRRTSCGSAPGRLSGHEARWLGAAGRRQFGGAWTSRPASSGSPTAARWPSRSATWSASSDRRRRPLVLRLPRPVPRRPSPAVTVTSRTRTTRPPWAGALAAVARPGDLLCLWGDLGAGKTHLAKAFGAGLGVDRAPITSPSFILMAEYEGRLPLFHVDLYRLADADATRSAAACSTTAGRAA